MVLKFRRWIGVSNRVSNRVSDRVSDRVSGRGLGRVSGQVSLLDLLLLRLALAFGIGAFLVVFLMASDTFAFQAAPGRLLWPSWRSKLMLHRRQA